MPCGFIEGVVRRYGRRDARRARSGRTACRHAARDAAPGAHGDGVIAAEHHRKFACAIASATASASASLCRATRSKISAVSRMSRRRANASRLDHRGPLGRHAGRQPLGEAELAQRPRAVLGLAKAGAPAGCGADERIAVTSLAFRVKTAASADGLEDAALHRAAVKRRVLRFRTELLVSMRQGRSRSNRTRSAGAPSRAGRPAAAGSPPGAGQRAQHAEQIQMPVVHELERQRQQRLEPDDAGSRRGEGQALRILRAASGRWRWRRWCHP